MTEPPEPRRPEEGGGDEDYTDPDDFLRELAEVEADDTTIDLIGQGFDVTMSGPDAEAAQELADLFSGDRDRVRDAPLPNQTHPDAVLAEAQRRKKRAAPPGPRETSERNTTGMSAQEEAARLRELSLSTHAIGMTQEIVNDLTSKIREVQAALGDGHSELENATGPFLQAIDDANALATQIGAAFGTLAGIAQRLG